MDLKNNKKQKESGTLKKPGNVDEETRVCRPASKSTTTKSDISSSEAGPSARATKPGQNKTIRNRSTNEAGSSKITYNTRRKAWRALVKINNIPPEDRTEKDQATLAWAKKITVPKSEGPIAGSQMKRVRSDDESPKLVKRTKFQVSAMRPFNEVLKDQMVVAVIDRSHEDGSITPANWRKVEGALATSYLKVLADNPGPVPTCRDGGWHRNQVKLIACADQRSLHLYKKAVEGLGEVWPGASLDVIAREEIPCRPRARVWIPSEPSDPKVILQMLQIGNPDLPTENWKVAKLEEPKADYRSAVIILNKESLAALEKTQGVINYGFSAVTLKVYKKDADKPEEQMSVEDTTSVLESSTGRQELLDSQVETLSTDTEVTIALESLNRVSEDFTSGEDSDGTVVEAEPQK